MPNTAKLFMTGRSQAVRLPLEYRFEGKEVYIRREPNGDVVLSRRPSDWESLRELQRRYGDPGDFLGERRQGKHKPSPFEGIEG
ncbi:MAG TPA: AbrB/MazE/SpoVT family DNA-binding domain-containing protein [Variovorax sp.]|nr:AbrB/MazE/SpoVT family DNA-binding domain-containing protein [Variovorax sp.]